MQIIQVKIPCRIPFVGGFTDLSQFYRHHGGETITCPIDKYITVSISHNDYGGLDIQSKADLPWGMGLGSSGTYHVALISAFAKLKNRRLSKSAIATLAYELETGIEGHSTGRQDSLACLFKGISKISYSQDNSVKINRFSIPQKWEEKLNQRLLLFDTGERKKSADSINDILSKNNSSILKEIVKLPGELAQAWNSGNIDFLGTAINLQERYRRQLSKTCKSPRTDMLLQAARKCGAGARLTGAGLGCLLCYCPEKAQPRLRRILGIPEIKFSILW